jgi:hypothetical protein
MRERIVVLIPLLVATISGACLAQSTPFMTDSEIQSLVNEISGDRAFEHIRWLSHWHRDSGTDGYFESARYVMRAAEQAGLEDVRFVEQPLSGPNYNVRAAELWLVEPVRVKLADAGDHALFLSDKSRDADLTAELVWVGQGSEAEIDAAGVEGKIVLTSADPNNVVKYAVWAKGALGVIAYPTSEGKSPVDHPDQVAWTRIPAEVPDRASPTFAFALPPRRGEQLREVLQTKGMQDIFATGSRTPGGRAVVHAFVDTDFSDEDPGKTGFVEGWIRGTAIHDQQIVLTAHLQEEQGSANDDGSGCANLLEIARTLTTLIQQGHLEAPSRDIRFWWTDEIDSEYLYFRDNPDDIANMLVNVNQDMVGANQSLASRVQHLILAPHSRTSFLDAVFESIGTYVIETNNGFLAASRQNGLPRPHTRPIYAARGSRDGYNAAFVPYFDSSDHKTFVEGVIGVPAVGMINWDDPFIHSSDDDLDKIDQTQLERNAFIVAALAHVIATAGESDVSSLAAATFSQGRRRLADDQRVAMQQVSAPPGSLQAAWRDAQMLIEKGLQREVRALESVRVFIRGASQEASVLDKMIVAQQEHADRLMSEITDYFQALHGVAPRIELTEQERRLGARIPGNTPDLDDYFTRRKSVTRPPGLHALMADEAYNFVDGHRSYLDIFRAVRAEALVGGSWYYGDVSLDDVTDLLDLAVEAGVLELQE